MTKKSNRNIMTIAPQPGPQEQFLSCCADIAIYGGAAGGGKTWALLLEPLRHVTNPGFSAVIFRRTYPQITNPGGLWDEAYKIYSHYPGASPKKSDLTWEFPSGAKIKFAHLNFEDTVYEWQGAQVPLICFDELTTFTEYQFFYLLSRNRSLCGVKPYIRAACNPDATSWVKTFIAPWVDKNYPIRAEPNEMLRFVRRENEIVWIMDESELRPNEISKTVTFIPASIYDNKILLERNPEYLSNLEALPSVEKARLLYGDWDIKTDRYFTDWCPINDGNPWHVIPTTECPDYVKYYVGLDYGYVSPFAAILIGIDYDGTIIVYREIYRTGMLASEQAKAVVEMLESNGIDTNSLKYAGHDVFAAQRGAEGRQEPIVDIWRKHGLKNIIEAGKDTLARANTVRECLKRVVPVPGGGVKPIIQVMDCCVNLIREMQSLQNDPNVPELPDTRMDDHAYDALGHVLTSRIRPAKKIEIEPTMRRVISLDKILEKEEQRKKERGEEYVY